MIFSVDGIMFKSVTKDKWHRSSQNLSTSLWKGWGTNLTITCWHSKSSQSHSYSSCSAWRHENYPESESIKITTTNSSQSMPKPRSSNPLAFCSFVCWTSTTCVIEALLDLADWYLHQECSSVLSWQWICFLPENKEKPSREKHLFDWPCYNQQLLTKDIVYLVEGRDLSLDSSEIRNLNLFLSIFHGLLINLLQRCCNRWLLDQITPQAQSFHCPSRRLHFENRFDLIKVVPGMLLESGWFFEST